jgi:PAS domain S-box-containing protein
MSKLLSVLIVEDNQADVDLIRESLLNTGKISFRIESVSRLSEALARLKNGGVDLVLLDLGLPDSQGLATFHKLREATAHIPVIISTMDDNQEMAVAAVREGAHDYLIKDLSWSRLLTHAVLYAVERKRAEEKLLNLMQKQKLILSSTAEGILGLDLQGNHTFINMAASKILGYEAEELLGRPSHNMWHHTKPDGSPFPEEECVIYATYRDGTVHRMSTEVFWRKDGTCFPVEYASTPIYEKYQLVGAVVTFMDISDRKRAEEKLLETLEKLRKAVNMTIQVMVSAVEVRDPYTAGHQIRSADLARAIAAEMGLPPEQIEGLRMAGSIHDIGKLSVPAEILSKPTKLSGLEFSLIKEHARRGFEIMKDVESPWPLAEIVLQHHERMDGTGYPQGLTGGNILLEARILAVADVVEAMASHRPYRPALGIDAALEEIEKNKGILYDVEAVEVCLKLFRKKGFSFD